MLRRQVRAREMLRAWANVIEDDQVEVLAQEDTKTRERTRRTRLPRFHDPTRRVVASARASRITTSTPDQQHPSQLLHNDGLQGGNVRLA